MTANHNNCKNSVAKTNIQQLNQIEIVRGEGIYLYDQNNKQYIDLISGICVNNLGHCHPNIVNAIKKQTEKYLHVNVFGEFSLKPQHELADLLTDNLPDTLNTVYFTNSGSEAIEGAIKLARKHTGRNQIIAFKDAYHGSSIGAMSIGGNEKYRQSHLPLLPQIFHLEFNNFDDLKRINNKTACVIVEPIQGEAGVILPEKHYLNILKSTCKENGVLLIFDEVQTAFGRSGKLFAFKQFNVIPDVIVLAKAMSGGLPLGAFICSRNIMQTLGENPAFNHVTTFGGNPISCVAAKANIETIINENIIEQVAVKEHLFKKLLIHKAIKEVRGIGLMFAVEFETEELTTKIIEKCFANGLITDCFLFNTNSIRISPPLIIDDLQIKQACDLFLKSIDEAI